MLLTDASFGNAEGSKSQIRYIILMVDDRGWCNVLHYGSNKAKRIARSVMAAEVQELVHGFDYAYVVQDLVAELLGRKIQLEAMIDSKTVFSIVAKDGQTTERRLQIDVLALRQSYYMGELSRVAWIPGNQNPADSLTKPVLTTISPLFKLMTTNNFTLTSNGWATSREKEIAGVLICGPIGSREAAGGKGKKSDDDDDGDECVEQFVV